MPKKIGEGVKNVKIGDRVLVYHGCHSKYNIRPEADITVVKNHNITSLEAAFVIIASMGLGGVRKLELEIGERAMVMGQGVGNFCHTVFENIGCKSDNCGRSES